MMPGGAYRALTSADETGPFISFSAVRQNEAEETPGGASLLGASTRRLAALLADLGDLLDQLIVEVVRRSRNDAVADQIERRPL